MIIICLHIITEEDIERGRLIDGYDCDRHY